MIATYRPERAIDWKRPNRKRLRELDPVSGKGLHHAYGSFFRFFNGEQVVTVCHMGMITRLFMVSVGIMLSRFFVMVGGVRMMFCRVCM